MCVSRAPRWAINPWRSKLARVRFRTSGLASSCRLCSSTLSLPDIGVRAARDEIGMLSFWVRGR
jgi:hypothetical protein